MFIPSKYEYTNTDFSTSTALMGISLGKYVFMNKEVMNNYCEFYSTHFKETILMIFDEPKIYNILALNELDMENAQKRIEIASNELNNFLQKRTRKYDNILIRKYNDFKSESYFENIKVIENEYKTNKLFKKDCDDIVFEFLSLQSNKEKLDTINRDIQAALKISIHFLLDEVAMICCVASSIEGDVFWTYPGINYIVESIYSDKYSFSKSLNLSENRRLMEVYVDENHFKENENAKL